MKKTRPRQRQFRVYTEERVTRSYLITADTPGKAREKMNCGEYDSESPSEAIDCEIVRIVAVEDDNDNDNDDTPH